MLKERKGHKIIRENKFLLLFRLPLLKKKNKTKVKYFYFLYQLFTSQVIRREKKKKK
jgi:hypothetical protein